MRVSTVLLTVIIGTWPLALRAEEPLADLVFIDKSERRLELRREGAVIRTYQVALGGNPEGPKRQEGDQRTPEGNYVIDFRKTDSAYHLALHISYPNTADRAASAALGVPTGGDIFIHGLPNYYPLRVAPKIDWTLGCVALDDAEIEEMWRLVPDGTVVTIVP
jgi:murein L,D-transpeptidase YafK